MFFRSRFPFLVLNAEKSVHLVFPILNIHIYFCNQFFFRFFFLYFKQSAFVLKKFIIGHAQRLSEWMWKLKKNKNHVQLERENYACHLLCWVCVMCFLFFFFISHDINELYSFHLHTSADNTRTQPMWTEAIECTQHIKQKPDKLRC